MEFEEQLTWLSDDADKMRRLIASIANSLDPAYHNFMEEQNLLLRRIAEALEAKS